MGLIYKHPLHRIIITSNKDDKAFTIIDEMENVQKKIDGHSYLPDAMYGIHIDRMEHENGEDWEWQNIASFIHITPKIDKWQ